MEFRDAIRAHAFQKSPTFLSQCFKDKSFDRSLTKQEQNQANASVFIITASGQKVYIYDRTHIPASNPVERIQV
jgi:hypothetical protein